MTATAAPVVSPLVRTALWPHQTRVFLAARDQQASMLAAAMGSGKGLATLALLEHDIRTRDEAARPFRALVLCPKSVAGVWPAQLTEHAVSDWRSWNGTVEGVRGPLKNPSVARRAEALVRETAYVARIRRPFLAVVNYEASWQGDMGRLLAGTPWDALILDESHRIKAAGGSASRKVAAIAAGVRARGGRILALTGTPMPHSPLDLYGQYRALDPTIFGTNNALFKARYAAQKSEIARGFEPIHQQDPCSCGHDDADHLPACIAADADGVCGCQKFDGKIVQYMGGRNRAVIRKARKGERLYIAGPKGEALYEGIRDDRANDFAKRAGRIMHQVTEEELSTQLGLPEAIDVHRTIELDASTRRVYDELEKDMIARVGDGTVTAANAMVNVLRLAQVASGIARDAVTGEALPLTTGLPEKARLLDDTLSDLPEREPVVVVARFTHDLDMIRRVCESQGRRYGELSGRRRDGLTHSAQMSPDIDVLGTQIQAGSEGISLTRARYCIFYTLGFELSRYLQMRKRLHRPGQTRSVTYVHLLATGTVEQAIYGALRRRQQVVEAVLQHIREPHQ